jgi:hypothetical protein
MFSNCPLREVSGDAWSYNWDTLFLKGNKYRNLAFMVKGVSNLRE